MFTSSRQKPNADTALQLTCCFPGPGPLIHGKQTTVRIAVPGGSSGVQGDQVRLLEPCAPGVMKQGDDR